MSSHCTRGASMPQLIDAECWPARGPSPARSPTSAARSRRPRAIPSRRGRLSRRTGAKARERQTRSSCSRRRLAHLLPGSSAGGSFRWDLLCGRDGHLGADGIDTQFLRLPTSIRQTATCSVRRGSDAYRLRPDESGYDNLALAGDWTDNGLKRGLHRGGDDLGACRRPTRVLGRSRSYRITGPLLS